jgi:hypothetical protein
MRWVVTASSKWLERPDAILAVDIGLKIRVAGLARWSVRAGALYADTRYPDGDQRSSLTIH